MSTPESKIVIGIDLLLRKLGPTLKGLDSVDKKLRSLANIKINARPISTTQFDKAAASAQRLHAQQQKLAIQTQSLADRQERTRQAADRLALAQQRLAAQSEKAAQGLSKNASAHVKDFQTAEKAALRLQRTQERIEKQSAASLQRQRSVALLSQFRGQQQPADAHVRDFRAQQRLEQQASNALQRQRSAALVRQFSEQQRAAKQAADARAREAKRAADAEIKEAKRVEAEVKRSRERLERGLTRVGDTFRRVGAGLSATGRLLTVALTAPLAALSAISFKAAKDIDAQVNTLKAFTGSAEAAEARLKQLIATARQTPGLTTQLALLIDGQLRLANATVETIDKVAPAIGRLNAVQQLQDPARFAQNLVQLVTQDFERIDLKELVGQSPVAGQIITEMFNVDSPINAKAIREAARKMGLTTVDTFFAAFADAAARNQALATVTESIGSRLAKQADRLTIALRPLGLAILDAITPAINALIPFIERLSEGFASLSQPAQQALLVIGGLAALLGPALLVLGTIATSLGGLITALAAVAGVIGTIGLPALAAVIAGLVIVIGEWIAILTALGLAWKTNFLNIRGLVTDAARAVIGAFNRIKAIFEEAIQRILPTLQSITTKVLNFITAAWEKYGKDVVAIVGAAFRFVIDVTETFLKIFTDFVDLVLKLIDGDWRGAWRAFARIIVNAVDSVKRILGRLGEVVVRAMEFLIRLIGSTVAALVRAGKQLAERFIAALATEIIRGFPTIRDAITAMLIAAVASVNVGDIARRLIAALYDELRRAASEQGPIAAPGPFDFTGLFLIPFVRSITATALARGRKKAPGPVDEDKKGANALRKARDDLAKAQDEFQRTQEENRLAETRSAIDQQFELTKDGLDRELRLLQSNFDDRLVAVNNYFAERRKLEDAQIDAELAKEKALSKALVDEFGIRQRAIEREFKSTVDEINRDPKLKGRAKELSLQTAETEKQTKLAKAFNDFETQNAEVSTRILILQKKRKDVAAELTREEQKLLEELQKQEAQLTADLFAERGATVDAAAIRLRQQFKDTLGDLHVDVKSLAPELQTALNAVDLKTLKGRLDELPQPVRDLIALLEIAFNRAQLTEQVVKVDRTLAELRLRENEIQNKVLDGVISERDARAQIVGLQQVAKGRLLDILAAQLAIAKATPGQQDEVLRLQAQIQEIERLGREIDEIGQRINEQVFADLESGFANVFSSFRKGIDGVKDAVIGLGESILDTFNRILAESFVERIFGPLLKPDSENTEGTIGGVFSKLFGLKPKAPDTAAAAALSTAGTAAGTALTTGGTAAATALTTGGTAAATALATGGATASATLVSSIATSAATFAATVQAAAAAFAATVGAAGSAGAIGGLGGLFAAKGGLFTPQPGGRLGVFAEAGYPEAVLTTDPKHASRQFQILRAYLRETKGLFGRIPQFASGGFISPRDTEMSLLSSISRAPSINAGLPELALASAGGGRELRQRFVLVDDRSVRDWINSPEGEEVIIQKIIKNAPVIRRLAGGRR